MNSCQTLLIVLIVHKTMQTNGLNIVAQEVAIRKTKEFPFNSIVANGKQATDFNE